jgi:hypothetical protein
MATPFIQSFSIAGTKQKPTHAWPHVIELMVVVFFEHVPQEKPLLTPYPTDP